MQSHLSIDADTRVSLRIDVSDGDAVFVFGHGAGAGMLHPFMEDMSQRLVKRNITVVRYNFPYMESGRRRPDHAKKLQQTIQAVWEYVQRGFPDKNLFLGGKSMGGRMASQTIANYRLDGPRGLIFFGFPLHQAGNPDLKRADHLTDVSLPMLFLQGTWDKLAEMELINRVVNRLGSRALLCVLEGADHSFQVLKRSGIQQEAIYEKLAETTARFIADHTS